MPDPNARQFETRTVTLKSLELRAEGDENARRLVGRAIVYGEKAELWPDLFEIIEPGALTEALSSGANVRALHEHDRRALLGSTDAGTLKLTDSPQGLDFELDVAETQAGNDCLALVRAGELTKMSFGFRAAEDAFEHDHENDVTTRRVKKIAELGEITLTATPYYTSTKVEARSLPGVDADAIAEARRLASPNLDDKQDQIRRLIAAG